MAEAGCGSRYWGLVEPLGGVRMAVCHPQVWVPSFNEVAPGGASQAKQMRFLHCTAMRFNEVAPDGASQAPQSGRG